MALLSFKNMEKLLKQECIACSRTFWGHGELSEHLRSDDHILRLESSGLLRRNFYMDWSISDRGALRDTIDTTSETAALVSLRAMALRSIEEEVRMRVLQEVEGNSSRDGTGGANSNTCVICLDAPCNAAFIPCGHLAACLPCGRRMKRRKGGCPVCRRKLMGAFKIFN